MYLNESNETKTVIWKSVGGVSFHCKTCTCPGQHRKTCSCTERDCNNRSQWSLEL